MPALARFAEQCRRSGGVPLRLRLPDNTALEFGPQVDLTLRLRDPALLRELACPTLGGLADAYVEGRIDIDGDLLEALPIGVRLVEAGGASVLQRVAEAWRPHRRRQDRAAIAQHYDVGNEFYRLWLDRRMVYSCAYFRTGAETIDEAQRAKLDHICRKLRLEPGERLLDVGCGWGGLVMHAAQEYGVRAVGITLSRNQAELARERVRQAGMQHAVDIQLMDYRDLEARFGRDAFDKVASVGMFEHVGLAQSAALLLCSRRGAARSRTVPEPRHHVGGRRQPAGRQRRQRLHRAPRVPARRTAAPAPGGARNVGRAVSSSPTSSRCVRTTRGR